MYSDGQQLTMLRPLILLLCVVASGYGLLVTSQQTNSTTKSTDSTKKSTTNSIGSTTMSTTKSTDSTKISTTKSTGSATISASNSTIPTSGYTIDHLVSWILEEKLQRARLEKKLENLTNAFKRLEQTATGMNLTGQTSAIVNNATTTLDQLQSRLDGIDKECNQNRLDIAYLNQTAKNDDIEIRNLSANSVAKSDILPYAFSAHHISTGSPFVGDTLIFAKIGLNENDVYNNNTGMFTAPVSGLYVFHATVCTQANKYIYANIVAHGKDIGILRSGDEKWPDCSSESAVSHLLKGDQVFLRTMDTRGGPVIFDDISPVDSFSGHLLSRLTGP